MNEEIIKEIGLTKEELEEFTNLNCYESIFAYIMKLRDEITELKKELEQKTQPIESEVSIDTMDFLRQHSNSPFTKSLPPTPQSRREKSTGSMRLQTKQLPQIPMKHLNTESDDEDRSDIDSGRDSGRESLRESSKEKKEKSKKKLRQTFSSIMIRSKTTEDKKEEKPKDDFVLRNENRRNTMNVHNFNTLQLLSKSRIDIKEHEIEDVNKIEGVCQTYLYQSTYSLKMLQQRKEAINELYMTEVNFNENMKLLYKHFFKPFEELKNKKTIREESFNRIFMTIEDVIKCSDSFIEKLQPTVSNFKYNVHVGELMEDLLTHVWPYIRFTMDYSISQHELRTLKANNPMVAKLLKEKDNEPELKNETIQGMLIQPVQRMMRYPILLKQILKYTSKSHTDYRTLFEANADYTFFIHEVNNRAKLRDKLFDLSVTLNDESLIEPWRYLVKEIKGDINKKHNKVMYIFNDMILVDMKRIMIDEEFTFVASKEKSFSIKKGNDQIPIKLETEREVKEVLNLFTDIVQNKKYTHDNDKHWFETLCKFKSTFC